MIGNDANNWIYDKMQIIQDDITAKCMENNKASIPLIG